MPIMPAIRWLAGDRVYGNTVHLHEKAANCPCGMAVLPISHVASQLTIAKSKSSSQHHRFKLYPRLLSLLLCGLMLILVGCDINVSTEVNKVDIRGTITEVNRIDSPGNERSAVLGALFLDGVVEEDTRYDKASIAITRETAIFKQVGSERQPADFADLAVGMRAEAAFSGPVMETYPLQGTAAELVILGAP